MKKWLFILSFLVLGQSLGARELMSDAGRGSITFSVEQSRKLVTAFKEIARLAQAPAGDPTAGTTCGYIFPGDGNKFGCTGTGKAASDVAAACRGGGSLACSGSGASKSCTCAFD